MNEGTQGQARPPGGSEVNDMDISVLASVEDSLTPPQQGIAVYGGWFYWERGREREREIERTNKTIKTLILQTIGT